MKCTNCEKELDETWKICPFCGTEVPKPPKAIDEFLKDFVDDYGTSIFKEENNIRLERAMSDWPDVYADDRDIIKLLQIKNIPDRLCSVLEQSDDEKNKAVQDSANILIDKFGINGESASKMLSIITDAIGLKATVEIGDGSGTFKDPRDGQVYKTCKIGDQVWLAENLKYETSSGCCVYDNNYQNIDKYGYMYSREVLSEAIPEGWHLPTEDELKKLEKFIVKTNRCKHSLPYLVSKEWFSNRSYVPKDFSRILAAWEHGNFINSYGFSALLGGVAERKSNDFRFDNLGIESYWLYQVNDPKEQNNGIFSFHDGRAWTISNPTSYDYDEEYGIKFVNVVCTHFYIRLIKD